MQPGASNHQYRERTTAPVTRSAPAGGAVAATTSSQPRAKARRGAARPRCQAVPVGRPVRPLELGLSSVLRQARSSAFHASRRAACVVRSGRSLAKATRPGGGVSGPFRAALKTYRKFEPLPAADRSCRSTQELRPLADRRSAAPCGLAWPDGCGAPASGWSARRAGSRGRMTIRRSRCLRT